jgi:ABC-type transport system substrate-binding protein
VRFHNGETFDAKAVRFNFEYQRKHNPGRGVQVYMKNVREIRAIEPHTVQLMLNQPDALILDKFILGPTAGWMIGAPRHMERVGWKKFLKYPVGTGPYMVEGEMKDYRKVPQGQIYASLVANRDYWNKESPKIAKVIFVNYSSQPALRGVMEGTIDLVTSLIPKDTLEVAKGKHSRVVKGRHDVRMTQTILNLRSPKTFPLRDVRVRKALNYAINKKELMRYAFKGNAVLQRGILTENCDVDLSDAKPYEWDVQKARELLKDAGYEDGFKMKIYYLEQRLFDRSVSTALLLSSEHRGGDYPRAA